MAETEVPQTGTSERRDAKWYARRFIEVDQAFSELGMIWPNVEVRVQVILGILRELARDARMAEVRERRKTGGEEPATEAQLDLLRRYGVQITGPISRHQASRLIDALKARPVKSENPADSISR
jgi:hypothetical protein